MKINSIFTVLFAVFVSQVASAPSGKSSAQATEQTTEQTDPGQDRLYQRETTEMDGKYKAAYKGIGTEPSLLEVAQSLLDERKKELISDGPEEYNFIDDKVYKAYVKHYYANTTAIMIHDYARLAAWAIKVKEYEASYNLDAAEATYSNIMKKVDAKVNQYRLDIDSIYAIQKSEAKSAEARSNPERNNNENKVDPAQNRIPRSREDYEDDSNNDVDENQEEEESKGSFDDDKEEEDEDNEEKKEEDDDDEDDGFFDDQNPASSNTRNNY